MMNAMKHLPLIALTILLAACIRVDTSKNEPTDKQVKVEWQALQTGTGAYGMPIMQITLVNPDTGTMHFRTECEGTVSADEVDAATPMALLCWWAGGGERFTVIKSGDTLTVRNQQVDEESGYGEWVDVETIEL